MLVQSGCGSVGKRIGDQEVLTQIYEVSTAEEARSLCRIGIDHIGVLIGLGEFPREQTLETAATIAGVVHPPSKLSALFLTADFSLIEGWAKKLQPAILHLGAAPELLGPDDVAALKSKLPGMLLMRSIPVIDEASIALARSYEGIADFLLLDSHREVRPSDRGQPV